MLNLTFSGTQVLLGTAMLVFSLGALYFTLKYFFNKKGRPTSEESNRTKYANADVFKYETTFFRVGLLSVLAFSLLVFNWTQYSVQPLAANNTDIELFDLDQAPPITFHKPPPPPPPPPKPIIEVVPDELVKESKTFASMDARLSDVMKTPPPRPKAFVPPPPPLDDGASDEIIKIVERMPVFGECMNEANENLRRNCSNKALMTFIGSEVRYPSIAQEISISGTAVIRFVIEKDGSMTNLEIVRDPGGSLGEEALRVAKLMAEQNSWTPGEQRGRPVRVQFNLPVKFQLQ